MEIGADLRIPVLKWCLNIGAAKSISILKSFCHCLIQSDILSVINTFLNILSFFLPLTLSIIFLTLMLLSVCQTEHKMSIEEVCQKFNTDIVQVGFIDPLFTPFLIPSFTHSSCLKHGRPSKTYIHVIAKIKTHVQCL